MCYADLGRELYASNWVLEEAMGYLDASKESGVPRTTIEARMKKIRQGVLNREGF